jgi:hypothetical protein
MIMKTVQRTILLARLVSVLLIVVSNVLPTTAALAAPPPRWLEDPAPPPPPTLTTGKSDYFSGEIVDITGSGFAPGTIYALPVMRPDGSIVIIDPVTRVATPGWETVLSDAEGHLAYSYQLDGILGDYEARAYPADWVGDWSQPPAASVIFMDADIDFTQCENDSDNDEVVNACNWVTGALNQNNSLYTEGDAVPQRLFHKLSANNQHTFVIEYDFSKNDVYAYDFLTSADATQSGALLNECANLPGFVSAASCAAMFTTNVQLAAIPSDAFDAVAARENPPGAGARNIKVGCDPACAVGVTVQFPNAPVGPSDSEPGEAHDPDSDPDCFKNCGNSKVVVAVIVTTAASNTLVGIWFAGHLAESADPPGSAIGWGTGCGGPSNPCGASSISGSPFHLRYTCLKESPSGTCKPVGNRDNQVQTGSVVAPGIVTITKDAVPDDAQDFAYTGDLGSFSLDDDADGTLPNTTTFTSLIPGVYSVSETPLPSEWDLTGLACSDPDNGTTTSLGTGTAAIDVDAGETITCTYTNTKRGHILIDKVTVPGGDPQSFDFTLTGGPSALNQTFSLTDASTPHDSGAILPGSGYNAAETVPSGWTLAAPTCSDQSPANNIDVSPGETVTCTFTNTKQPGAIIVKKIVDGQAPGSDWQYNGTAPIGAFTLPAAGGQQTFGGLDSGNYTIAETAKSGYMASVQCDTGESGADTVTVNLDPGETVTCTFTNAAQPGTLTIVKVVNNDNGGGLGVGDFPLFINGSPVTSGTPNTVAPGTYIVSETQQPGYTGVIGGDCDANGSVTVNPGDSKTCTITNDDDAPSLTLIKTVVNNNGGTASASAWTLTATGPTGFSGSGPSVSNGPSFDAGTYTLSESSVPGYTASAWVCVGGSQSDDDTVVVGLGEDVTCTITNDDIQPKLIVIKHVDNANGGDAASSDFTLTVTGNGPSPASFPGADTPGTTVMLNAGAYSVGESGPSGYSDSFSADCSGSIAIGETKTCTITNDDVAPTLTLIKNVVNDNGGNAGVNDFGLSIGGTPVDSGETLTLDANTPYIVDEAGLSGYTFVSITGDAKCPAALGGNVTLDEGENVTCTITNDDIAPTLTLIKIVVNDDGGDAVVADFPLFINGNPVSSGIANTLSANTLHTVSETNQPGYTASVWGGDCAPDGTITLNEGDNKTCTITNDDVAPTLKLVKAVVNDDGGNAVADDWTLSADAEAPFAGRNFSNAGGSGVFETIFANAGYDLSETSVAGYTAGSWSCDGGTLVGAIVALDEGENVTCTITNDDIQPELTIVKFTNGEDANAAPGPYILVGSTVNWTYVVTNIGSVEVINVSVTDDQGVIVSCPKTSLAIGEAMTCTATGVAVAGQYANIGTVIGASPAGPQASANDPSHYFGAQPAITIVKNGPVIAFRGGSVTYAYLVSNSGNVPLSDVAVMDNKCSPVTYVSGDDGNGLLDVGETWTFTCTYTPGFTFPNPLTNIATATGKYGGQEVSDTDSYVLYPFTLRKKIFLYWDSPQYLVPNRQTDNTPFTVQVLRNGVPIAVVTVSQNAPKYLWLSEGNYKFKEINVPAGYIPGYDTITFTTGQGYPDWTFPNVITFDLAITKTGPASATQGSTITYWYTVTNAGPASVAPKVKDNKCSPLIRVSGDADGDGRIDPGEVWKYKCNYVITQPPNSTIKNTATVSDAAYPNPPPGRWLLGGDRKPSNNTATWTVLVK